MAATAKTAIQESTSSMITITRIIVIPVAAIPGSLFCLAAANTSHIPATSTIAGIRPNRVEITDVLLNIPDNICRD